MKGLVGGPLLVGGLGPGTLGPPLNPALNVHANLNTLNKSNLSHNQAHNGENTI